MLLMQIGFAFACYRTLKYSRGKSCFPFTVQLLTLKDIEPDANRINATISASILCTVLVENGKHEAMSE